MTPDYPPPGKPTVEMISPRERALARAIIEEFRGEIREMIREELASISRPGDMREEGRADITGTHSLEYIADEAEKWKARYQRKIARDRQAFIVDRAIARQRRKGISGFFVRYGWPIAGAIAFTLLQAIVAWIFGHHFHVETLP